MFLDLTVKSLLGDFTSLRISDHLGPGSVTVGASCRPGLPADLLSSFEDRLTSGCSQVQLGFRYETRDQRFTVYVLQLSNCSALCLPADQKMYLFTPLFINLVYLFTNINCEK